MFNSFEDDNIRYIHLRGNEFQFINGSIFSKILKFLYLNLALNLIDTISMKGLHPIRELNLAHNKIEVLPEWCNHVSKSYVPNSKTLQLNSHYITGLSTCKCLPSLSFLPLQDNSTVSTISINLIRLHCYSFCACSKFTNS
jgi:hypothetical protein